MRIDRSARHSSRSASQLQKPQSVDELPICLADFVNKIEALHALRLTPIGGVLAQFALAPSIVGRRRAVRHECQSLPLRQVLFKSTNSLGETTGDAISRSVPRAQALGLSVSRPRFRPASVLTSKIERHRSVHEPAALTPSYSGVISAFKGIDGKTYSV
jgi:hypothetical protein